MAFISPYQKDREFARRMHQEAGVTFIECHVAASLEVCEKRDIKGLYAKARKGTILNFTGVSDPYETPVNPDLKVDTGAQSIEHSVE